MASTSNISKILVFLQVVCLCTLLIRYGFFAKGMAMGFQLAAIWIAVWALLQFEVGSFSIFPDLKPNAKLIKSGPYQYVRNPMYTSLLLYFGPFVFNSFDLLGTSTFILLLVVLIIKLRKEEDQLKAEFVTEKTYFEKTYRLIPFIY